MQDSFDLTKIRQIIRPHVTFRHLVILCLDSSGSMQALTIGKISKAESVSSTVCDLFTRMKSSYMRDAYSFAIVNYDHRAKVIMPPTEVVNLDDKDDRQYDPTLGFGGAQFISEGLMKAKELAEQFMAKATPDGLPYSVTIMIVSDGGDMNRSKTVSMANMIKKMFGGIFLRKM